MGRAHAALVHRHQPAGGPGSQRGPPARQHGICPGRRAAGRVGPLDVGGCCRVHVVGGGPHAAADADFEPGLRRRRAADPWQSVSARRTAAGSRRPPDRDLDRGFVVAGVPARQRLHDARAGEFWPAPGNLIVPGGRVGGWPFAARGSSRPGAIFLFLRAVRIQPGARRQPQPGPGAQDLHLWPGVDGVAVPADIRRDGRWLRCGAGPDRH